MAEWLRRLWFLLNRRRFEHELARDMEAHRAMMGRPSDFGNTLRLREQSRDVWGWRWLDDLTRDGRLAIRTFRRSPAFTAVVLTSLALGFALAASTMAVVNAYLVRGMPYPNSDRLFHVMYGPIGAPEPRGLTAFDWSTVRDVVEIADYSIPARFFLTDRASPVEVNGLAVAPRSLEAYGVQAVVGRALQPQDFAAGAEPVAMIGDTLWRTAFSADPAVVGRIVHARRSNLAEPVEALRIVGVLPPEFRSARDYSRGLVDVAVPLPTVMRVYFVRLQPGTTPAQAEARITTALQGQATWLPPDWTGVHLQSIKDRYLDEARPLLLAVTFAAALVVIIVCANVATLMLLRVTRRQKEFAVRAALGAGTRHLARMLLIETGVLCGAALILGVGLTAVTMGTLAPSIEENLGRSAPGGSGAIAVDGTVLAVVAILGLFVVLAVSCLPVLVSMKRRLADALRKDGRTGAESVASGRVRSGLVAVEVAGSLALLVACALMIQSVASLLRTDLGYSTAQVVRARIALPARTYPDAASFAGFFDRFTPKLTAALQNGSWAFTNFIPFYEAPSQHVEADGAEGTAQMAGVTAVSESYFSTLRIDIREGRVFTVDDRRGAEPVAIISESLRRQLWPTGGAIGRRIRTAEEPVPDSPLTVWRTVVGVARDVRQTYVDDNQRDVYLPHAQAPNRYAQLFIRSDQPAAFWQQQLGQMAGEIDRDVLVSPPRAIQTEGDALLAKPKFLMSLLTGFGAFTLMLTVVGIYGVTAYAVAQREREIAIRMALGASRQRVVRMFLRSGSVVIGCGLAMGLAGSFGAARLVEHQLHGVTPFDTSTLVLASALMSGAAFAATWWPAQRATARDPALTLKEG